MYSFLSNYNGFVLLLGVGCGLLIALLITAILTIGIQESARFTGGADPESRAGSQPSHPG